MLVFIKVSVGMIMLHEGLRRACKEKVVSALQGIASSSVSLLRQKTY